MLMINKQNIIYILLGIILIMFLYIIFRKPSEITKVITSTEDLENMIKAKEEENLLLLQTIDSLNNNRASLYKQIDSLDKVKNKIKIEYREIYKYIDNATNHQLDSIIRANW